jgi:hypothetical protein
MNTHPTQSCVCVFGHIRVCDVFLVVTTLIVFSYYAPIYGCSCVQILISIILPYIETG